MSAELDWTTIALETGKSLAVGLGGLLIGVWRWGKRSAQHDQKQKDASNAKIDANNVKIDGLDKDIRSSMTALEKAANSRLDDLVEQFKESFNGLRRQLDDDRLHTEQNFVRKDDFRDFREEYREDMRDLKKMIAKA